MRAGQGRGNGDVEYIGGGKDRSGGDDDSGSTDNGSFAKQLTNNVRSTSMSLFAEFRGRSSCVVYGVSL